MADTADERPDPDALLKTLDDAARQAVRGKLRVYFGASAGVGKTYAMLVAARARRRAWTCWPASSKPTAAARPPPCWTASRRCRSGRGLSRPCAQEFDLDGALTRHPALALVDELAHSNAPGSRHAKRWQDIEEMLAAGIDVWTTLNVQHLDSLNEAVGSITGVRVWETVPDEVFDGADEVILVDLSADELLRRLKEGKVYLPEQARHATRNFFRKGNLIALRELALRRTADHVDDDVQAYRRDRAIEPVWRTREAVVACIGADEDAEYVIRSAHRLSQQLECDLHVVTVDTARAPRRKAPRSGCSARWRLPTRWARAPRRWPAATWSTPWSAACAATTSPRPSSAAPAPAACCGCGCRRPPCSTRPCRRAGCGAATASPTCWPPAARRST